ncbi:MAG: NADH-quinone oxidoreductase subunit NuoE [Nitrospirota bacterium]
MNPQSKKEDLLGDILEKYRDTKGNIIPLLQDIQDIFGYIPEDAVDLISKRLDIPESKLYGVTTFYAQFHLRPRGENIITACCGTACHVKGSERIINSIRTILGLGSGEDTTRDQKFTLEKVACIGTCSMAPVIVINKDVYGGITPDKITRTLKKYQTKRSDDKE